MTPPHTELTSPSYPPLALYTDYPPRCPSCRRIPWRIRLSTDTDLLLYRCECSHEWIEVTL